MGDGKMVGNPENQGERVSHQKETTEKNPVLVFQNAAKSIKDATQATEHLLTQLLQIQKKGAELSEMELNQLLSFLGQRSQSNTRLHNRVDQLCTETKWFFTRTPGINEYVKKNSLESIDQLRRKYDAQYILVQALIGTLLKVARTDQQSRLTTPDRVQKPRNFGIVAAVIVATLLGSSFGRPRDAEASSNFNPIYQTPIDYEPETDDPIEAICQMILAELEEAPDQNMVPELAAALNMYTQKLGPEVMGQYFQDALTEAYLVCRDASGDPDFDQKEGIQLTHEAIHLAQTLGISVPANGFILDHGSGLGNPERPNQGGGGVWRVKEILGNPVVSDAEIQALEAALNNEESRDNILVLQIDIQNLGDQRMVVESNPEINSETLKSALNLLGAYGLGALNLTGNHEVVVYFDSTQENPELVTALRLKSDVEVLDSNGNVTFWAGAGTLISVFINPETNQPEVHYADPFVIPGGEATLMSVSQIKERPEVQQSELAQRLLSGVDNTAVVHVLRNADGVIRYLYAEGTAYFLGKNVINNGQESLRLFSTPDGNVVVGLLGPSEVLPVIENVDSGAYGADRLLRDASLKFAPDINAFATPGPNSTNPRLAVAALIDGLPSIVYVEDVGGQLGFEGQEASLDIAALFSFTSEANPGSSDNESSFFSPTDVERVDSTIQQTTEITETITTATVKSGGGRVRKNASTSTEVVASLPENTTVTITNSENDGTFTWYTISVVIDNEVITGLMREDTLTEPETESQTATTTETVLNPGLSSALEQSAVLTQPSELVHPDLVSLMQNLPASRYQVTYEGQTYRVEPSVDQVLLDIDERGDRVAILVAELPLNGETVMVSLAQAALGDSASVREWQLFPGVTEAALEPWEELNVSQEIYQLATEWLADDDTPENIRIFIEAFDQLPPKLQTEVFANGAGIDFNLESGKFVDAVTGNEVGAMTAEYQLSDEQFAAARRTVINFIGETINPDSMVGAIGGLPLVVASTQETGIGYERNQFTDRFFLLAYAQLIYVQLRLNGENPDINNILQNLEQNGIADYQDLVVTISNTKEVLGQIPLGDLSIVVVNVDDFRTLNNLVDDGDILTYENWRSVMRFNPASGQLVIMEAVDIDNILGPKASATQLASVRSMSNIMQLINFPIIGADKRGDNDYVRQIGEGGAALLYYDYGLSILAEGMFPVSIVPLEN